APAARQQLAPPGGLQERHGWLLRGGRVRGGGGTSASPAPRRRRAGAAERAPKRWQRRRPPRAARRALGAQLRRALRERGRRVAPLGGGSVGGDRRLQPRQLGEGSHAAARRRPHGPGAPAWWTPVTRRTPV